MSDSDQPLTPEEEEVRRLLAEARHTGPTPPEVVVRLDRVLDDLAHEPDGAAPVVDLARRRRRVASLLVAAAAVVVVGIGVAQLVSPDSGSDTLTSGSAASEAQDRGQDSVQPKAPSANGANPGEAGPIPQDQPLQDKGEHLLKVRREHLSNDLAITRSAIGSRNASDAYSFGKSSAERAAGAACGAGQWGRGRFVPVSYGGTPAVVVFRRPVGDTQVADVFLCGSSEPVRSVTLPAP